MNGLLITLEGGEGAGKTTQINRISSYLEDANIPFIKTREPGGTAVGEKIRDILLDNENKNITAVTEALLYAAARAQHVNDCIRPALQAGSFVICDRFTDSSVVYQGVARNLGLNHIEAINSFATGGLNPDITFFLDLPPAAGLHRKTAAQTLDRLESEALSFHQAVWDGYHALAAKYSDRIKIIDASQSADEVWDAIKLELDKVINIYRRTETFAGINIRR